MIELLIKILIYLGLTTLFVESEPIIRLKRLVGLKEEEIGKNSFKDFFIKLTYCNWCSSVYISFIIHFLYTNNLIQSISVMSITSFVMWFIENKIK